MSKKCSKCKTEKTLADFRKDKSRSDGVQPICKECAKSYHKSAYMERYSSKVSDRNKKRAGIAKEYIDNYKAARGCSCCNEKSVVCLDLHHLDPSIKDFTISVGQNRSMEKIKNEVEKCVVVCRNCHAKIHAGVLFLGG